MAAKTKNVLKVTLPNDTDILFEREFDAPRELVWRAMSDPELFKQWWGPREQEIISIDMDVRPGGTWAVVTRGPDGVEHPFRGEYREISQPSLQKPHTPHLRFCPGDTVDIISRPFADQPDLIHVCLPG